MSFGTFCAHSLCGLFVLWPFAMGHGLKGPFIVATGLWLDGVGQDCLYFIIFGLLPRARI
jgi:hypothetical protein